MLFEKLWHVMTKLPVNAKNRNVVSHAVGREKKDDFLIGTFDTVSVIVALHSNRDIYVAVRPRQVDMHGASLDTEISELVQVLSEKRKSAVWCRVMDRAGTEDGNAITGEGSKSVQDLSSLKARLVICGRAGRNKARTNQSKQDNVSDIHFA